MEYIKLRRYLFLLPLHIFGLITTPNFHRQAWKNEAHNIYTNFVWVFIALSLCAQWTSTFLYAIHDVSEFLQRFYESILLLLFFGELFVIKMRFHDVLELFHLQEHFYKISNRNIHRKYVMMESIELAVVFVINTVTSLTMLIEPFLPISERNIFLMTTIYGRKDPRKVLISPVWEPSFIDIDKDGYFILVFSLQILVILLGQIASMSLLMVVIIFPTFPASQYEMLGEFVKLLGAEHRDGFGELIFYTDIATGAYLTETQMVHYRYQQDRANLSKKEAAVKLKQWKEKSYPAFYLKQLVRRYQELEQIMMRTFSEDHQ
ncbi:uncharacterized protein LOC113467372 isoform X2 [Diaphorina citri]|uniref:Uncharacterized protein LOC113467372 isoform X2 n=1 Tax=Diaphorina citri TaxID=121845 RepID=A0A3Q0ISQ5_DIACI|nr:uncharacterized protein LOC113467372 isoform X2 [Diaphorina citri]